MRRGHYIDAARAQGLDRVQRHLVAVHAAMAAASSDAFVSHISAAVAHELTVWSVPMSRVHVTRNRESGGRIRRQTVVHTGRIEPDEWLEIGGIPVTSVARTVVDIARTEPFEQAVVVGDSALRAGKTTRGELLDQLERASRRIGTPAARRVLSFLDGRAEGIGESRSRVALHNSGIPKPELQAWIIDTNGSPVGRADFLWPELGIVGEFDGNIKYHKELRGEHTTEQVEKCGEDALRALGWCVVRWTWAELTDPEPLRTRIRAAAEISRTAPRLGTWQPSPRR